MKILVISDTHGDKEIVNQVLIRHQNIDFLWHLGDSCLAPNDLNGFISVKGNCDFFDYPLVKDIELDDFKIRLTHGHKIYIPFKRYMEENHLNLLLTGHTHVACIEKYSENMIHVNPGSLSRPRDDIYGSYAIITINNHKIEAKIYRLA